MRRHRVAGLHPESQLSTVPHVKSGTHLLRAFVHVQRAQRKEGQGSEAGRSKTKDRMQKRPLFGPRRFSQALGQ